MQIGSSGIPTGATVYYGAMRDYYDGQSVYYIPQDDWDSQYKYWLTYGKSCFDDGLHAQFWTVLDNSKTNTNSDGMFLASSGVVQAAVYWPGDNYAGKAGIDLTNNSCVQGSKLAYYRDSVIQPLGEEFYNYAFSDAEKAHVIATTKSDDAFSTTYTHTNTGSKATISTEPYPDALQNDHVFSLSAEEVVKYMPEEKDWDALANFDDPSGYALFQGSGYYLYLLNGYSPSRSVPLGYWLRSPIKSNSTSKTDYPDAIQVTTNYLSRSEIYPQPHVGWRPAMNLDKNNILFSSSVLSKESGEIGENCLKEQNHDSFNKWGSNYISGNKEFDASYAFANKWKLTLLDSSRKFNAVLADIKTVDEDSTETVKGKDQEVTADTLSDTDEGKNKIANNDAANSSAKQKHIVLTIDYSGATSDKKQLAVPTGSRSNDEVEKRNEYVKAIQNGDINQYVSAVITDKNNKNVLYYGRIKEIKDQNDESGEVKLQLPDNLDMTQSHLYVFSEQANDPVVSRANSGYYQTNDNGGQAILLRRFYDDNAKTDTQKLSSTSVPALDYYTDYASPMIELPVKLDINGTKTWDDFDNVSGKRPNEVKVDLYADGKYKESVVTSASNEWRYRFSDLPEYDVSDWHKIEYSLKDEVAEYISSQTKGDLVAGTNGANDSQIIDLKNTKIPGKWYISGTKHWDDQNNKDKLRPDSITVRLLANGETIQEVKTDAESEWKYDFGELPAEDENGKTIQYSVEESPVEGYTFKSDDSILNGNDETMWLDITNTHITEEPIIPAETPKPEPPSALENIPSSPLPVKPIETSAPMQEPLKDQTAEKETKATPVPEEQIPETGDTHHAIAYMLLLSFSVGIGLCSFIYKKKHQSE